MSDRKVAGIILSEMDAQKLTEQLNEELLQISNSSHNLQYHTVTIEKDGQAYEIEVPIDDIDLLDDMHDEDLTEEGERSLGIIDASFDTTLNESATKKDRNRLAVVNVVMNSKEDQPNIVCPYTGSTDVYQIDSSTWASYETDQPFLVRVQMNDEED